MTATTSSKLAPLTVLVVDSDTRALGLAASHIEYWLPGVTVMTARSNAEAISHVAKQRADFIVFDLEGASANWGQLLAALCEACPNAKVVLTGRSAGGASGFTNALGYFRKPYRVDELIAVIDSSRQRFASRVTHGDAIFCSTEE